MMVAGPLISGPGEDRGRKGQRAGAARLLPSRGGGAGLTLSSDGLTEDDRCAVLYGLDACSGHGLQGETERRQRYGNELFTTEKTSAFSRVAAGRMFCFILNRCCRMILDTRWES